VYEYIKQIRMVLVTIYGISTYIALLLAFMVMFSL